MSQNTPAIMATEFEYLEMWAQDIGAPPIVASIVTFKAHNEVADLALLHQFSVSDLKTPNGGSGDTLISDLNKSVTDATPLFAHTG